MWIAITLLVTMLLCWGYFSLLQTRAASLNTPGHHPAVATGSSFSTSMSTVQYHHNDSLQESSSKNPVPLNEVSRMNSLSLHTRHSSLTPRTEATAGGFFRGRTDTTLYAPLINLGALDSDEFRSSGPPTGSVGNSAAVGDDSDGVQAGQEGSKGCGNGDITRQIMFVSVNMILLGYFPIAQHALEMFNCVKREDAQVPNIFIIL